MVRFRGYQEDPDTAALEFAHIRRLWPFVRPYRAAFALCLAILFVSFGLEVLGPYLIRLAVDGPLTDALQGRALDRAEILWIGGAYLGVIVGAVALGYWYAMTTTRNGQRVIRDVRLHLFRHLLQVNPRFFDRNPAGKLVTRATSDVENLNELISTGVLQSAFDLIKIVGILIVLAFLDPGLALVAALATPVLIGISLVFRGFVRRSYRRVRSSLARQNAFTAEAIGGMRVTRAFGQEEAVTQHYAELNSSTRSAWIDTVFHFAAFVSTVDFFLRATQVTILYAGGASILEGTLSVGTFVMFWLCLSKLIDPIRELGEKYNVLQSAFSSSERIFQILDEPIEPASPAVPVARPRGPAELRFEDVRFAYVPDLPVLDGVSFTIAPGETTAVVGPTGAGKSTILSLVSRLYDPTGGRVLLDGHPLPELDLWELRQRIAVVPQDVFLFTGSVLDNVRLFDESIPQAKVEEALDTIGALEFVESLDGGLQAEVAERGATMSLGERQLLAFARALVSDPDLLVLDEATANIDNHSEEQIQRGLRRLLRDRTALVVAHRLSTVRGAHQILVVQKGQIVERGTHAELVQAGGLYAGMASLA